MLTYDCEIWVLASVASVLWGFDATGLHEEDMLMFRHYLRTSVLSVPII
jgi:hypothetical protein